MATISELLRMALINLNPNDSTQISRLIGLAQIDQAKRMLDKGYQVHECVDEIIEKDPDMAIDINTFINN